MMHAHRWLPLSSRIAAALFGGYVFVWGFTAVVVALGLVAGAPYDEALLLAYLLAFVVYLVAFLWSFAARSVLLTWLVLAGGGAAMTGAAWALTQTLSLQH